jgi:replicative DNA helicase
VSRQAIADLHAERAILCACLTGALVGIEYADAVGAILQPSDFYDDRHALAYDTLQGLRGDNLPHGADDVCARLGERVERAGGAEYVRSLTDRLPGTLDDVEAQARRVAELAVVRGTLRAMMQMQAEADQGCENWADWLDRAESAVSRAAERRHSKDPVTLESAAEAAFTMFLGGKGPAGLSTGYRDLDAYTLGMHPGDLTICAGRPGQGKTALGLGLALGVADNARRPVLFCTLEMPNDQIAKRAISLRSGVDGMKIRSHRFAREDFVEMTRAVERFQGEAGVWIDDEVPMTPRMMARKIRKIERHTGKKLAMACVDYLQLMRAGEYCDNREQEIASISRQLKAMAKTMGMPILALSQLNRDSEKSNRRPQLSDLRESGAIEQDADNVLFVYRQEVYQPQDEKLKGKAEIIISKQRSGPTGIVEMAFRKELSRFDDLDSYHGGPEA